MEAQLIADDNTGPAMVGAGQHKCIVYSSSDESDVEDMDDDDDESGDAERDADHVGGGKGGELVGRRKCDHRRQRRF